MKQVALWITAYCDLLHFFVPHVGRDVSSARRGSFYPKTVASCRFVRDAVISIFKVVLLLLHMRIVKKTIAWPFLHSTVTLRLTFLLFGRHKCLKRIVFIEKLVLWTWRRLSAAYAV